MLRSLWNHLISSGRVIRTLVFHCFSRGCFGFHSASALPFRTDQSEYRTFRSLWNIFKSGRRATPPSFLCVPAGQLPSAPTRFWPNARVACSRPRGRVGRNVSKWSLNLMNPMFGRSGWFDEMSHALYGSRRWQEDVKSVSTTLEHHVPGPRAVGFASIEVGTRIHDTRKEEKTSPARECHY